MDAYDVEIFKVSQGVFKSKKIDQYLLNSIYDYERINSLFKNVDTLSF